MSKTDKYQEFKEIVMKAGHIPKHKELVTLLNVGRETLYRWEKRLNDDGVKFKKLKNKTKPKKAKLSEQDKLLDFAEKLKKVREKLEGVNKRNDDDIDYNYVKKRLKEI